MAALQLNPVAAASVFRFAYPICRADLELIRPDAWRCPIDSTSFHCVDGIWRFLPSDRAAVFAPFLRDYTAIRDAEGYGYDDLARLQRLPDVDPADPMAWQWRMRAISFASLLSVLPLEQQSRIHEVTRSHTKINQIEQPATRENTRV